MIRAATVLHYGSDHPSPLQGATQTGVEEVTKRFKKYEPVVFSSAVAGRPEKEKIDGVAQVRISTSFIDNLFGRTYLQKIAQEVIRQDIKIVHVRNRPLYMPQLRKYLGQKAKLVLHEHNQNIADTLSKKQAVEVFDSIDAYVAVSKFTYDFEITNRYPQYKNKSGYILNGVNLEKFRPVWEQREKANALRKKYGVDDSIVILFTGALRKRKGVHVLLEAFKTIAGKYPKAKLVIAGGSKDNLEAKDAYAKKLYGMAEGIKDRVIFTGFIPPAEVNDIYLIADVFAALSLWDEAFGLVFAEASATGLPVLASRRGGIPEIVLDGKTGLIVNDPDNVKETADKLAQLLGSSDLREKFGTAARKYMEEKFSWDRTAKEIEDLYDRLLR